MRRLMLLRHADSDRPAGVTDFERPLSTQGRLEATRRGLQMAKDGLLPALAMVSTARRAQETWDLVVPAVGSAAVRQDEPLVYEASAATLLALVRRAPPDIGSIVLVGHNPGLQQVALQLAARGSGELWSRMREKFPTAGLAVIEFDIDRWADLEEGAGRLVSFETARRGSSA